MAEQMPPEDRSPPDQGEIDPELMELAEEGTRPSLLKPILYLGVIAVGIWFLSDWTPEIRYAFTSYDPVALGKATSLSGETSEELPHNRYVSIEGIPSRRAESDRYRFFKLIGADIYVAAPQDGRPSELSAGGSGDEETRSWHQRATDRTYFDGRGRLMDLSRIPERYRGLRSYYREHYGTRFCGVLDAEQRREIRRRQKAAILDRWKQRYRKASPEKRRQKNLSRRPSDEKLKKLLAEKSVCQHAYLLRAGVSPGDHWWYLAIAGLLVGFMLMNAWWIVRWGRRVVGSG
ncbi:MAG: hypothetical protein ABEL76_01625 [Bradymonadaceae bacterium]